MDMISTLHKIAGGATRRNMVWGMPNRLSPALTYLVKANREDFNFAGETFAQAEQLPVELPQAWVSGWLGSVRSSPDQELRNFSRLWDDVTEITKSPENLEIFPGDGDYFSHLYHTLGLRTEDNTTLRNYFDLSASKSFELIGRHLGETK